VRKKEMMDLSFYEILMIRIMSFTWTETHSQPSLPDWVNNAISDSACMKKCNFAMGIKMVTAIRINFLQQNAPA